MVSLKRRVGQSHMTRSTPYRQTALGIDISHFDQVLSIDIELECVVAEPGVTMERLVAATVPHGLMPQVVPEFRGITIGGAISGGALESSSHRYGQFADSCLWYEVILGDGTILITSEKEHPELFFALPGSYGTLGIVTLTAIRLIPAKRSVRVHFTTSTHFPAFKQGTSHFVDGMVLSPHRFVLMEGNPDSKQPTLSLTRRSAPWFFQHVYSKGTGDEIFSLSDYLFRFDRGAFWMGQFLLHPLLLAAYFFRIRSMSSLCARIMRLGPCPRFPSKLFRLLMGKSVSSQNLYAGLHSMPMPLREVMMIQDVAIPSSIAESFVAESVCRYRIFPVWLCPVQVPRGIHPFSLYSIPGYSESHLVNVGLYGVPPMGGREATLDLERRTLDCGGRVGRYSQCYLSKEDLRRRYDRDVYQRLRTTYRAEGVFCDFETKLLHS